MSLIIIFLLQIIFLNKFIRNKFRFTILIIFEVLSIIFTIFYEKYYNSLPGSGFMPGLTYLKNELLSIGARHIFIVMLVITIGIKIYKYLQDRKETGKNYFPIIKTIMKIIAIMLILFAMRNLIIIINHNNGIEKIEATVIDNIEDQNGFYSPVVEYNFDGIKYTVTKPEMTKHKYELNSKTEIFCYKSNPIEITTMHTYNQNSIVLSFIVGVLLFIVSCRGKKVFK